MLLLTQREAASVLRLSQRSLERMRVSGLGPKFVRVSRRSIRYREPSPEQREYDAFCKTWDALPDLRRAEFVKSFAPDIRDLLASGI